MWGNELGFFNRLKSRWLFLIFASAVMLINFLAFQNFGDTAGSFNGGSAILVPSADQFSQAEYHRISSDYACEVLTNDRGVCGAVLANYSGDFESLIQNSGTPSSQEKIAIAVQLSCSVLASGETQCLNVNVDGSIDYHSSQKNGAIEVYDYNMSPENLCAVVNCGNVGL